MNRPGLPVMVERRTGDDIVGDTGLEWALRVLIAHERAATRTLTMIPSENALPPLARLPLICDLYGRYLSDDPQDADWAFPAARHAADLETRLTLPLLRRLSGAEHADVRPLSGANATLLVLAALGGPPGSPVALLAAGQGGYHSTGDLARRMGLRPLEIIGADPYTLDLEKLGEILARHRPPLVYIDQSHGLAPYDVQTIVGIVRSASPATRVHVDVSQWMGLIFGRAVADPLAAGADSLGGATHMTFPGPQKGFVATNDDRIEEMFRAVRPQFISSHHFGAVCALGLALLLFAPVSAAYATATVANSRALGARLAGLGLEPQGASFGFSRGHQLWIRTAPYGVPARVAAERLYRAGIRANVLHGLPGIAEPALRLGVNEATWLGMTARHVPELGDIIAAAVLGRRPEDELAGRVAALRRGLSAARPAGEARALARELIRLVLGDSCVP